MLPRILAMLLIGNVPCAAIVTAHEVTARRKLRALLRA
jgi:hypothetical protein